METKGRCPSTTTLTTFKHSKLKWMCPAVLICLTKACVCVMCAKAQHVTHWCQEYCLRWVGWEFRTKISYSLENVLGFLSPSHWLRLLPALPVKLLEQCQPHKRHLKPQRLSLGDSLREKPLYKIPSSVHSHSCKPSLCLHCSSLTLPSLPPGLFNPLPVALLSDGGGGGRRGTDPHGLPDLLASPTKADFCLGWIGRCQQDTELGTDNWWCLNTALLLDTQHGHVTMALVSGFPVTWMEW